MTDAGQRAKFYQLTAGGKKQLAVEHDRWTQLSTAIAGIMNPAAKES